MLCTYRLFQVLQPGSGRRCSKLCVSLEAVTVPQAFTLNLGSAVDGAELKSHEHGAECGVVKPCALCRSEMR
jgi:hypothetical protein